ncbi:biotin-dependent carboxyltransferase family protein [Leadbetterella byssophila]|uniref:Allophanate hydrolase subunit 2 n=1 Tax=Leadbetterella byssophila (strain DSM 17132 / JCM 16389 / KACC 11308 / NBRC 106382 / 4M15) TaxID=649349 RepID=E4RUB1_LEAB4|nr:biotin-dependent carboxyltransferase family protein [Leadbetterella byssophila]ADQ16945.1 Allophanate hydrolase subunit 2 [Leadbetterella byssophila DSM 17132]
MKFLKIGLNTSIQDLGRKGARKWGIGSSGAMDQFSLQSLNAFLNKPVESACLEFTFPAPEILFEEEVTFCNYGADFGPRLNDSPILIGKIYHTKPGDTLRFTRHQSGMWSYLGFAGSVESERWLGSYSQNEKLVHPSLPKILKIKAEYFNRSGILPPLKSREKIRFVPGKYCTNIPNETFTIDASSNRMGYRLKGPALTGYKEQISFPVERGCIQLLPDGQLVVLMSESQTTGGYPLWGWVVDIDALSQLKPGQSFFWEKISAEEAWEINQKKKEFFQKLAWK